MDGPAQNDDDFSATAAEHSPSVGSFGPLVILIGGVAGSGKTTVGTLLARVLGWQFADADSFHSAAAIAKMRAGQPLTDADREPWLARIASWLDERIAAGEPAVAGCSALRRSYRDRLLGGRPSVRLIFLTLSPAVSEARLAARHGHFFTRKLLSSQFAELEPVQPDEHVLLLDASGQPELLAAEILGRLGLTSA